MNIFRVAIEQRTQLRNIKIGLILRNKVQRKMERNNGGKIYKRIPEIENIWCTFPEPSFVKILLDKTKYMWT